MNKDTKPLRFSHNPLNLLLGASKRQGLRIGYMESALRGFYLNSIDTGIHPRTLTSILCNEYPHRSPNSINELFRFFINEGDRVSYQIMYPCLLSSNSLEKFEAIVRERFLGAEGFVQQGRNLFKFVKYAGFREEPFIWMHDIERGIIGWDMGQLVCLVRIALKCGYITAREAWEYIELAGEKCASQLRTPDEIDKSFLIGWAMKTDKIDEWDRALAYYSLLRQRRI